METSSADAVSVDAHLADNSDAAKYREDASVGDAHATQRPAHTQQPPQTTAATTTASPSYSFLTVRQQPTQTESTDSLLATVRDMASAASTSSPNGSGILSTHAPYTQHGGAENSTTGSSNDFGKHGHNHGHGVYAVDGTSASVPSSPRSSTNTNRMHQHTPHTPTKLVSKHPKQRSQGSKSSSHATSVATNALVNKTTVLDYGDDETTPVVEWGTMSHGGVLISVSDDQKDVSSGLDDDDEASGSDDDAHGTTTTKPQSNSTSSRTSGATKPNESAAAGLSVDMAPVQLDAGTKTYVITASPIDDTESRSRPLRSSHEAVLRARKLRRRKRRSPNRDFSDSDDDDDDEDDDEDESGLPRDKPRRVEDDEVERLMSLPDPADDPNYSPFDDDESKRAGFKVGFAEDRNKRYRRTMEDSHAVWYNYGGVDGMGFFAVFDGHAGKTAAEYCGHHMHENFLKLVNEHPHKPVPELLNDTFLLTDTQLSQRKGMHSGCTAVVAVVRTEERDVTELADGDVVVGGGEGDVKRVKRRVLYTANVGDARAVLCRSGHAVRLSYDHKGSDQQESRRILESGGFVLNNRVNGVLAVTRSLGDMSMKEWVIGAPYTTETTLTPHDPFLILACDGIWDVCTDQASVDLIKNVMDPQEMSDMVLDYALDHFSTDNLTVVVVRFDTEFMK